MSDAHSQSVKGALLGLGNLAARKSALACSWVALLPIAAVSSTPSRAKSDFNIKVQEHFVKSLLFEDVARATDDFSEANELGVGGYGTVYQGVGPGGVKWAVKRAKNANEEGIEDFQNEVRRAAALWFRSRE